MSPFELYNAKRKDKKREKKDAAKVKTKDKKK